MARQFFEAAILPRAWQHEVTEPHIRIFSPAMLVPVCFTPQPIMEPQPSDRRFFAQSLNPYANRLVFPPGAVLQGKARRDMPQLSAAKRFAQGGD